MKPISHPIFVASYSFGLSCLYFLITLIIGFQLSRILYYKHNVKGFQFGFLLLCFIWGVLRGFFWLLTPLEPLAELALQGISINIQFATFTFLVLFYVHLVNKPNWSEIRTRTIVWYVAINSVFLSAYIAQVIVGATTIDPEQPVMEVTTLLIAGVMFLVLAILLAVYSWKLYNMKESLKGQLSMLRNNKNQVAGMTVLILLLFFSRAIRDFVAAAGLGKLYFVFPTNETLGEQVLLFTLYFAWEIIPTAFVIALFWHIPKTQVAGLPIFSSYGATDATVQAYLPPHLQYTSIQSNDGDIVANTTSSEANHIADVTQWPTTQQHHQPSRLFSDPQRYDSDDESDLLKRPPKSFASPARISSISRYSSSSGDKFQGFAPYNTNSPFNKPPE